MSNREKYQQQFNPPNDLRFITWFNARRKASDCRHNYELEAIGLVEQQISGVINGRERETIIQIKLCFERMVVKRFFQSRDEILEVLQLYQDVYPHMLKQTQPEQLQGELL